MSNSYLEEALKQAEFYQTIEPRRAPVEPWNTGSGPANTTVGVPEPTMFGIGGEWPPHQHPLPQLPFIYDRFETSVLTDTEEKTQEPLKKPESEDIEKISFDEEYQKLADELGLAVDHGEEAKLRAAVVDAGVGNYDRGDVDRYMRSIAKSRVWVWRPLRKADVGKINKLGDRNVFTHGTVTGGTPYAHPVPMPALLTVKQISEKCPSALFFVSDYAAQRPDPFLMVTTEQLFEKDVYFIVERWDEPGFRS